MKIKQWLSVLTAAVIASWAIHAEAQDEKLGWQHDGSSTKDWYSSADDPSFGASLEQVEPSVFKVTQDGKDKWGKVAFVVKDVDLDETPYIEVKVNKVDKESAFQVAVAPLDWKEIHIVIPRTSADGIHKGDIKTATGWSGKRSFCIALIIEGKGKATWFDNIKISSKK